MACIKKTSVFSAVIFSVVVSVCKVLSCDNDKQCGSSKWCCKGECKSRHCTEDLAGWYIAAIVFAVFSSIFLIGTFVYRCYYKPWRQRTHGGVIVVHPLNTGAAVLATQDQQYITRQGQQVYFNNNQAYPAQPSPYQPAHPAPTDGPKEITPIY